MIKKIADVFDAFERLGFIRVVDNLGLFFADIGRNTGHTSKLLVGYGFSDEELRDGRYQNRIHPDDRRSYLESWRRMNEGIEDELFCEYRVMDNTGVWRWIETHAVVMDRAADGTINTVVGMDRAIDARRQALMALEERYRDTRRKLDVAEKLTGSDTILRTDRSLADSLSEATRQFSDILHFDRIALFVARSGVAAGTAPRWHQVWSSNPELSARGRHLNESLHAVQNEYRPMIMDESPEAEGYQSLVVVPLCLDGVHIAVMSIESASRGVYRSEHLYAIESFARIIAIVLGNQRFIERKISHLKKDALTGFLTRASLEHDAPRLWDEFQGLFPANAVAMVDIDHFKRINDTYGHQTGDAVIRRVADVILRSLRREDMIIRYGGEEFLVLLPNADTAIAGQVMERLRIECEGQDLCECTETVTVSIGVSVVTQQSPSPLADQIATADERLYEAKRTGRNRVVSALPDTRERATSRISAS